MKKIKVGIVGLGYWGPNYVRNFVTNKFCEVGWVCDLSLKQLDVIKNIYPQPQLTTEFQEILKDGQVDLIAIATPPQTHYQIAKAALNANKHVLVAKPITTSSKQTKELIELAKKKKLLLHGDLTYLYTSSVLTIKKMIKKGLIGQPLYYDSVRSNLGLIQKDVNVYWDLACHDLAVLDYCFGLKPKKIFAAASKHHPGSKTEEMAHLTIWYSDTFIAHIHVSWLSPVKLRTIIIGGSKKMIYYDDIVPDEKLRIYDKGVSFDGVEVTSSKPVYRSGQIVIPKLDSQEALLKEVDEVVRQILKGRISYSNLQMNYKIIKILEAADESIRLNRPVKINLK